jgi:hypothetical protein
LNRSDTAKFVPGTYDLIVQAPGYGIQRFTRTFLANQTATVVFSLPTNRASTTKGATATSGSGTPVNIIDDTEDTGSPFGTGTGVAGKSITVDLQGSTPVTVTKVNVSAAAGPAPNSGRFNALRKFEIRTCNAALGPCTDPVAHFTTVAFTSADDAFPGDVPRPLQPNLNLRSFTLTTPTLATHVQLRALTNQCTGQAKYLGDQDDDPNNDSDCISGSTSDDVVRMAELEVFSSCNRANVAAGGTATASSTTVNFPASATTDGDRTGVNWGMGGGWNDATRDLYPDSLEVAFSGGSKTINEIRVYTLQDGYKTGAEPTLATTALGEGILDFEVQTWNGSAWVTVPGGTVTGNTKAITVITFPDITTDRIRVVVTNSRNHYSRIIEVEAFSCQ